MTTVYTLTYQDYNSGDRNVTVWSDELSAQKQAVVELLDYISDTWTLTDQETRDVAVRINDLAKQGAYISAMEEYERWELNKAHGPDGISWSIESTDLNSQFNVTPMTFIDFTPPADEEEDKSYWNPNLVNPPGAYQPTTCGATCRGTCTAWNEYAWADRADGTYVCYSCKSNGSS